MKRFFNLKGSEVTESDLAEALPFTTIEYSIGPGAAPLTATLTTLSALPDETRSLLAPLLLPPLTTPWNSKFQF